MSINDAKEEVFKYIKEAFPEIFSEVQILDELTIIEEEFYVFFYNSKRYIKERDPRFMLCGNSPLIVSRKTANVFETGTDQPIEYYLKKFREGTL